MAKIADVAKTLFNLGKGMGLEKPRVGGQQDFNLDKFKGAFAIARELAEVAASHERNAATKT